VSNRTESVVAAPRAESTRDECNGIAGEKGVHEKAIEELQRLSGSAIEAGVEIS
jgi:hypothetical protein